MDAPFRPPLSRQPVPCAGQPLPPPGPPGQHPRHRPARRIAVAGIFGGVGRGRQQQAEPERLGGRERVDAGHPLRHLRLRSRGRPAAPAAPGQEQEEQAEDDLRPGDSVGGCAVGRGAARVGDEVGDAADHGERDDPAGQEHRPVHLGPAREQHQDHRDDRHRTDRHADRERQYLADPLCHTWSFPRRGRRDDSRRPMSRCAQPAAPGPGACVAACSRRLTLRPGGRVNAPRS